LSAAKASGSARNSFSSTVTRTVQLGGLIRVEMDCGFPLVALVTKRSSDEMELAIGKHLYASFKATGVHVIKGQNQRVKGQNRDARPAFQV
jgi:tungstate transport system ATP-binding protein